MGRASSPGIGQSFTGDHHEVRGRADGDLSQISLSDQGGRLDGAVLIASAGVSPAWTSARTSSALRP